MLPEEWQAVLRQPQEKIGWLGRGVKWVEPENLYLTLKFLGETPDALLPHVEQVIENSCRSVAPFKLSIQGVGCFPSKQRPRAYWAGLSSSKILKMLQAEIAQGMDDLGFEPEPNEFVPHLTVARIKEPLGKDRLTNAFLNFDLRSSSFQVEQVSLVESKLRQEGPIYAVLKDFPLGQ